MQRKHESWRRKLPSAVLEYLEAYREIRPSSQILEGDLATVLKDLAAKSTEEARRLPELPEDAETRTPKLDGRGIAVLEALGFDSGTFVIGDNFVAAGLAESLEMTLFLAEARRLIKVSGVSLGRPKHLIEDETLPAHAIKDEAPSENVTRVNLPWPERMARLRDGKDDRTTSVDVHFDPIFMD
jgi:hypothetical protein